MAKVISTSGSEVQIQPSWGYAWKMSMQKGYKVAFWIGLLISVVAFPLLILWLIGNPMIGSSGNYLMFVVLGVGMCLIFIRPSQVMVNNEKWVDKAEWERDVANLSKDELNKKYFTRDWY